jgi:hypothetical protein
MKLLYTVFLINAIAGAFAQVETPVCIAKHCPLLWGKCILDEQCRQALGCNVKCVLEKANMNKCNLLCELNYGYGSEIYKNALQCGVDNNCFPQPDIPDGVCLVEDNDDKRLDKSLTDLASIEGQWWILKGLNCGQNETWAAGFDWLPCQYDNFIKRSTTTDLPIGEDQTEWIDRIGYCGGEDSKCDTDMVHTVADVYISKPGIMTHIYTDPPLTPQDEEWKLLSHPHPDWMLYIYCGSTPMGPYAGASVVVRETLSGNGIDKPTKTMADIPPRVLRIFKAKAREVGIDWEYDWCDSDVRECVYKAELDTYVRQGADTGGAPNIDHGELLTSKLMRG